MEKGDIAVIDYTATNKSSEKIFDSTIEVLSIIWGSITLLI